MKTAMQELIEKFKNEMDSGNLTSDQNYIMIWATYMAEGLIEKEGGLFLRRLLHLRKVRSTF